MKQTDPTERDVLPYFKDPKMKISLWTILKDSIGKDISKISVPVYFNDPSNILQRCASSIEYAEILEKAMNTKDPIKRLAYVTGFQISYLTNVEKATTKPFNPLLGETYELVRPNYKFLAE